MSHPAPSSTGPQPPPTNGVLTAPNTVNKKKQKRRAKLAARQASEQGLPPPLAPVNGQPPAVISDAAAVPPPHHHHHHSHPHHNHAPAHTHSAYPHDYADDLDYTSEEDDDVVTHADHENHVSNGPFIPEEYHYSLAKNKKKKKKKGVPGAGSDNEYDGPPNRTPARRPLPPNMPGHAPPRQPIRSQKQDRIWNTSTQEERERIKEFWLSLSEQERKSLLKIEKTAVLNKMKEQQKHSCSCTVCGRKRTAIEEELEVLYDAYYEELAQYANQPNRDPTELVEQTRMSLPHHHPEALPPRPLNPALAHGQLHHRTSRVHEIMDDEEPSDEDEVYSDEDDEPYSDEDDYESDIGTGMGTGFFDFGNNLTVKDGILTVADDLLKNDGRKFIEMMEQLAERRMQREQDVEYASQQPSHPHSHGEPPLDDDEDYDDEDDGYDSQDDYDDEDEEDDMGGMTEEQRMEEGRRMFQIFAARMFEQRVLTAYREKVALERQSRLLEELEEEDKAKTQKDAKKARDAEKKKNKKAAQKQAKAEEKAKKDAEKAAEEAAIKAAEEQKQEELRKKREEQKRKKEAEKKAQEEDRLRKEAEKAKRQQDERDRQAEAERRAREAKAQEKRLRDEQRKKEREDREAREREAREQKAHDDKQRRDQEVRARLPAVTPQIIKRPLQASQPAVPPALTSQKSSSGVSSPHIAVATPVIPKPATPGTRTRQSSEHESQPSSKFAEQTAAAFNTRTPPSAESPLSMAPRTILQNPNKQQQQRPSISLPQPTSHQGNAPGTHTPFQTGFGGMGFPPYGGAQSPLVQRSAGPFPPQPSPSQFRGFQSGPAPPGVNGFGALPQDRSFSDAAPPGFNAVPGLGHAPGFPSSRPAGGHHSRQSSTTDLETSPPTMAQPISRPAPIQRPSSVRPSIDGASEIDDLSAHLGSRALLDDADDALPEPRRTSNPLGAPRTGFSPHFQSAPGGFAPSPSSWAAPHAFPPSWSNNSNWAAPRPSAAPRPRALRLAVCNACRALGADYHDVTRILTTIDRSALDQPPSLAEVADICETEGDALNGGGTLHVRRLGPSFAVRYEPDAGARVGLGEIGSPVPGNILPVSGGFGRGFGAIGGQGF